MSWRCDLPRGYFRPTLTGTSSVFEQDLGMNLAHALASSSRLDYRYHMSLDNGESKDLNLVLDLAAP